MEDILHPAPDDNEFRGGGGEPSLGSRATPVLLEVEGEESYLGGPGGICSSVGEVSMIRTSSRSM